MGKTEKDAVRKARVARDGKVAVKELATARSPSRKGKPISAASAR
jgi:hypothetical protein